MPVRLPLGVGVIALLLLTTQTSAEPSGMLWAASAVMFGGLVAVAIRFGRGRTFGWNVAWAAAAAGLGTRALGGAMGGYLQQMGDPPVGTALVVAGAAGMAAALWLMIRERLEITFATDFLAEGVIIGLVVAYSFVVGGLAMSTAGSMSGPNVANLLPLVWSVAAMWLMGRLTRLTSEAPGAYRWLTLSLVVLTLAAAVNATSILAGGPAEHVVPAAELLAMFLWLGASLDPSLARPFDPVPVPDRAATAHVPMLLVLGATGPLLTAYALVASDDAGLSRLFSTPWLLLFGSLVLPAITAAQLIRRVQIEYATVTRDRHDPLTGLVDAAHFTRLVEQALMTPDQRPAILYLDLDRFKAINDSLGHGVGDELLRAVAQRLSRGCPPRATAGRLHGDEFAVLVPDAESDDEAVTLAIDLLERLTQRHRGADGRDLFVGASIGIALAERGMTAEDLIHDADVAMYRAKRRRDRKVVVYSSALDTLAQLRLSLESELRVAVQTGALQLYHQPKVDALTHEVVGFEALLRWHHPKLGVLTPEAFLPVAEETGLISQIGEWVLLEACRVLRRWQLSGRSMVPIAVNVSPRQLANDDLDELVRSAIATTQADPNFLQVELTEYALLDDVDRVAGSIERLREMGVRVALDDFGTGYSALSYLQRIRFDWIKLDRSFVASVDDPEQSQPVVGAVLALAAELGTPVVAEGVETPAQAAWLAEHGARVLQGWLFGRPEPASFYDDHGPPTTPSLPRSALMMAVGLDINRMRRLLAQVAIDSQPDATSHELLLLKDALETGGAGRDGTRFRRTPLQLTRSIGRRAGDIRHVAPRGADGDSLPDRRIDDAG